MKRACLTRSALAATLVLVLSPMWASAAELALLRNGFTIRHERRQVVGEATRLFLEGGESSYIDVPTMEIQGFEKDLSQPRIPEASTSSPSVDLNQVVNSASAAYHLDPDLVNTIIRHFLSIQQARAADQ